MKTVKIKTKNQTIQTDAKVLRFIQQFFYEFINIHSWLLVKKNFWKKPYFVVEILGFDDNRNLENGKVYSLNSFLQACKTPIPIDEAINSACAERKK